jgi:hypothetical protein
VGEYRDDPTAEVVVGIKQFPGHGLGAHPIGGALTHCPQQRHVGLGVLSTPAVTPLGARYAVAALPGQDGGHRDPSGPGHVLRRIADRLNCSIVSDHEKCPSATQAASLDHGFDLSLTFCI